MKEKNTNRFRHYFLCASLVFLNIICITQTAFAAVKSFNKYYISASGNDSNNGSFQHSWKTLSKLSKTHLQPGDTVYLQSDYTFHETLYLHKINGTKNLPITFRTYGNANAIISGGNRAAIDVDSCANISIFNISAVGSGRKNGNTTDGFIIKNSNDIQIANSNISGFQKSGLLVQNDSNIEIRNVFAHENGFAGIYVCGNNLDKLHCKNIRIIKCEASNNPGDPTNFGNHSGNGILAGFCSNILIDSCTATNNGWDMPRKGNGPVGIWCFEADSVVIQHCLSYKNRTSLGGEDGGGYDFDGGVTNSVIQYCLSYENSGSAFGIFQYDGASAWHDNTIRFCISENDGKISAAHAGAYVWNSSHDSLQMKNLLFYNNTMYNDSGAAISYSTESDHANFKFYNNIFIAGEALLKGNYAADIFLANDWFCFKYRFNIGCNYDFKSWCLSSNKEQLNSLIKGLNIWPSLKAGGNTLLTDVNGLRNFDDYKVIAASPVSSAGVDLQEMFNINAGAVDFNGLPVKKNFIGACHH